MSVIAPKLVHVCVLFFGREVATRNLLLVMPLRRFAGFYFLYVILLLYPVFAYLCTTCRKWVPCLKTSLQSHLPDNDDRTEAARFDTDAHSIQSSAEKSDTHDEVPSRAITFATSTSAPPRQRRSTKSGNFTNFDDLQQVSKCTCVLSERSCNSVVHVPLTFVQHLFLF